MSGTTAAARPELDGVFVTSQDEDFSFLNPSTGNIVSGNLYNQVVQEDGSGTLDFYYKITLNSDSSRANEVRTSGFTGSDDVDYFTDSLGTVGPSEAERFTGSDSGDVDFLFSPGLTAGVSSYDFFIKTDATSYDDLGLTDIGANAALDGEAFSLDLSNL